MGALYCPKCRRKSLVAQPLHSGGVTIDRCRQCGGVWFDTGELEETMGPLTEPDMETLSPHRDTPFVCPRCRKLMVSFPYPRTEIRIDHCAHCRGVWLDREELADLIEKRRFLRHTGELAKPPMPGGIKGALIRFVDETIASLTALE